ncbi:TlpA disulfide reductase family protein [Parafrigoribacterium mesophilum]|uniref:TlpA disulfide reductase family protein n=1 Tax=Parafrigoribacterium mesophilum TaxID=433646 RepID=UPI0031FC1609
MKLVVRAGALVIAAALALSGCSTDPLAAQYRDGGNQNYIAGDGTVLEIPVSNRDAPVEFSTTTDAGTTVSSQDYRGTVLVVNFWAAYCDPCRVEAPDLEKLSRAYDGKGVEFLGVNIADTADTSLAFARKYNVTYPSALDADSGSVRLAFAGKTAQSALPTTLVLDTEGRVAARILGQLQSPSILDSIIKTVLAEKNSAQKNTAQKNTAQKNTAQQNPAQ